MNPQALGAVATSEPVQLFIDGAWCIGGNRRTSDVRNPATGEAIGSVAHATSGDLDRALEASSRGFQVWKQTPMLERARILARAAALIRERSGIIARLVTLENGKPLAEAASEVEIAAQATDWLAAQAQQAHGRTIPARSAGISQTVRHDPVGPVAAFTPWNFPVNQIVRKIAASLAAGCSIIVKGPEETPGSCAEIVRAFAEAGVARGALNLVFGIPAEVSAYLIPHPVIRKVSFTGSTVVGKQLAALAGAHMKLVTMELGGHAPVLVFSDSDLEASAQAICGYKYYAAGQSCICPSRILVEQNIYARFIDAFIECARSIKVGDGFDPTTVMGPLANARRLGAMEALVSDAVQKGARLRLGGKRMGDRGYFFAPTVCSDVPLAARAMNEEPFGPLALFRSFHGLEDAITEANRLPYGLGAYAFTSSPAIAAELADRIDTGMLSINHFGLGLPETPFGGLKDSGHGFEGGTEAIEAYLQPRFVTAAGL